MLLSKMRTFIQAQFDLLSGGSMKVPMTRNSQLFAQSSRAPSTKAIAVGLLELFLYWFCAEVAMRQTGITGQESHCTQALLMRAPGIQLVKSPRDLQPFRDLKRSCPTPTFMAPLAYRTSARPATSISTSTPLEPNLLLQPLSTGRNPVTLQQESETQASMPSQISHSDPIKLLQLDLHDAISIQSRLMEDIAEFLSPPRRAMQLSRP
jgi:hypothetical protein